LIRTETARQRGVSTVEVVGARVEWITGGLYRGTLITREAEGYQNLWEWLLTRPTGAKRERVMAAVARAIACMHDAGIAHADLNLTNVLVRADGDAPQVLLIDFDRARVFSDPLSQRWRERNLHRLRRSLDKLDSTGQFFSPTDVELFCQAYGKS
jgi:3-deoxy-D-manno-octulosonic acid kinase